ncbi:MAG: WYL domain-containing protein [Cryomorphaceae bacterium]|nr:WYL domain-containing protein [Cryomorphaceae bacterium]
MIKQECRISLEVVPNYELTQQILKHGETVKVIEPQWLVNEVNGILERTLGNY